MDKLCAYLVKWIERDIKNKDLLFKKIQSLSCKEERIIVRYKDKERIYIVMPFLEQAGPLLEKLKGTHSCLVAYNTKENFEFLLKNWDALLKLGRHFAIIFVNPFSSLEKQWSVYPCSHAIISERSKLKPSLKALFDTVGPITKQQLEKRLG